MDGTSAKDWFQMATNVATIIALFVSALWSWRLFVRERLTFPRAELDITVYDAIIESRKRLVHVAVKVVNVGHVLLRPQRVELRIRQVIPIDKAIASTLQTGYDPVPNGKREMKWPLIVQRNWTEAVELEPGESDTLHADFVLERDVRLVQLYTFVSNPTQKRHNVGWTSTKFVSLPEDPIMANQKEHRPVYSLEEQQRRQPDQEERQQQQQSEQTQQQQQQSQQTQQQQQSSDDAGSKGDKK